MNTSATPQHTVTRAGLLYYNRRVPAHAKEIFGDFIRMRIDSPQAAEAMTKRLDAIWQTETVTQAVSLNSLGSRLINSHSQKSTVAARAMAERKTLGHLS